MDNIQEQLDAIFNREFDIEKIKDDWKQEVYDEMDITLNHDPEDVEIFGAYQYENNADEDRFVKNIIEEYRNGLTEYALGDKKLDYAILDYFAEKIDDELYADEEEIAREKYEKTCQIDRDDRDQDDRGDE